MKPTVVDTRDNDYIVFKGEYIRGAIRNKLNGLQTAYDALLIRMNNELPSKEEGILLMVALKDNVALNERAMFFAACIERASYLQREIRELSTIGNTFSDATVVYKLTLDQTVRYGL